MGKTKRLKGYGYYRTSGETGSQNRGYGLKQQKLEVRKFCEENKIDLIEEFTDDGISGLEFEKSHSLQDMLHEKKLEKCDVIVSKDSSRLFGRDDFRSAVTKRIIRNSGKKVFLSSNPSYDIHSINPTDVLHNDLLELFDRYERANIASRLTVSRRNRVLDGKKGSGRYPLGYMKTIDKETVVNPKTKPIVEFLFNNYDPTFVDRTLSGLSRQVKEKWDIKLTPSGIRKILLNEWYIGWVKHGKMPVQKGVHEVFISKKRFGMVNKMLLRKVG